MRQITEEDATEGRWIPDDMELFQIGAFTSLGLRRRLRYDFSGYRLVHSGCIPIGSIIMRMQGNKAVGRSWALLFAPLVLGLIFLMAGVFKVFQLDPSNGRSAVTFTILRVRKLAALLLQFFLT